MRPTRLHANGVPWLVWIGDGWVCEACGASGHLPEFRAVAPFARALGDLKRFHARCRPGLVLPRADGSVGDPLNWNRVER